MTHSLPQYSQNIEVDIVKLNSIVHLDNLPKLVKDNQTHKL